MVSRQIDALCFGIHGCQTVATVSCDKIIVDVQDGDVLREFRVYGAPPENIEGRLIHLSRATPRFILVNGGKLSLRYIHGLTELLGYTYL